MSGENIKVGGHDMSDPERFAGPSEHSQQVALFSACAQYTEAYPDLKWFHAIPNGGSRGESKRGAMIQGATMKAEGLKKGIYDTFLPVPRMGYHGFYLEMKAPGTKKLVSRGARAGQVDDGRSAEQIEFGTYVASIGYLEGTFESWQDAWIALAWYLGILPEKIWDIRLRNYARYAEICRAEGRDPD